MDRNQGIRLGTLTGYKALLLDPLVSEDLQTIEIIRNEVSGVVIFDQIESQLRDLIKLQYPKKPLTDAEYSAQISAKMGSTSLSVYGMWVYYPWRKSLVHLLPKEEFIRVRTIRNAYKITFEEQATLATKKIGIIGLSVGQSASLAVAIERAAGELRIADFDTLELSNLNRIRSSVCNLGLPKTHMVAREIAELDPYLPVKVFDDGITETNIETFLTEGGALDLLIEECDSVDIKVLAREHARKHRIPVLMDTSDRGMIDVERYDLDPTYPMLHGLLDPAVDYAFLKTLKTSEEKLPYIAPILGIDTMSIRLRASALEVGQSISTWPQLGGDVMHGGALCVYHAKEILLGRSKESFRRFADELEEPKKRSSLQFSEDSTLNVLEPWTGFPKFNSNEIEAIQQAISCSPSAGNLRPWQWYYDNTYLIGSAKVYAPKSTGDHNQIASYISLGACTENIVQTLKHLGFEYNIETKDLGTAHTQIRIKIGERRESQSSEIAHIPNRKTNRSFFNTGAIDSAQFEKILAQLDQRFEYVFIDDPKVLNAYGLLLGRAEKIRFTDPLGHQEFYEHELNWNETEARNKGYGLNMEHFDLSPKKIVGMQLSSNPSVIDYVNSIQGGGGFTKMSEDYFINPTPILLINANTFDHVTFIELGRQVEKAWLKITGLGLDFHPMPAIQFMCAHLFSSSHLKIDHINELKEILEQFKILTHSKHSYPLIMFRVLNNPGYRHRAIRNA